MKLLDNIKAGIGRQVLEGSIKNSHRDPRFINISEASNIGIIYDATDPGSFSIIRDFAQKLSGSGINLTVLGYVDSKELSEDYLLRKGYDFFCRQQLNWYFRPVSPVTDKFLNEKFDILFNLSLEQRYPVQFITALSPAKFKAGRYSADDSLLDLMIDISSANLIPATSNEQPVIGGERSDIHKNRAGKTDSEIQLSYLIDQLIHYLSIIKHN